MTPSDTCGYCGDKGHFDDQCPRRWADEPQADLPPVPEPRVTWHERPDGLLVADRNGLVLGQIAHLPRAGTWTARAGSEYLGEFISPEAATKAVERSLGV